ncbi:hypothetical protein DH2020_035171 [Rehmannia glutinosa]|uniref:DUF4283 domain-containing protein n=1 Tax=Rehmannia glutinosa TaxID=99300 RepID=A0ABR0VAX8_REHGL
MDPDDVARLLSDIKLLPSTDKEKLVLDDKTLKLGAEKSGRCLIAKVFASKAINREAFRQQMPRLLQTTRKVEIETAGSNFFVFEFCSMADRRRVLEEGPWNFFNNLIIFKEPEGFQTPSEMSFDSVTLWVQCHNVPIAFMQKNIAEMIGNRIGRVEDIDYGEEGSLLGKFLRIRVNINISEPLK